MNQLDQLGERLRGIEQKQQLLDVRLSSFSHRQILAVTLIIIQLFLVLVLLWSVHAVFSAVTAPG